MGRDWSRFKPGKIYIRANFDTVNWGGRIAPGIFAIDPETMAKTRVADDFAPRFRVSPDGRTLALTRPAGWTVLADIENTGLWVIDVEGKSESAQDRRLRGGDVLVPRRQADHRDQEPL